MQFRKGCTVHCSGVSLALNDEDLILPLLIWPGKDEWRSDKGRLEKTTVRLSPYDGLLACLEDLLMSNAKGKIVSKRQSAHGKKSGCLKCLRPYCTDCRVCHGI